MHDVLDVFKSNVGIYKNDNYESTLSAGNSSQPQADFTWGLDDSYD